MGVQRQMVGQQADVVGHQHLDAAVQPAGDAPLVPAPEQPVVHEHGIRTNLGSRFNQRQTGGHAGNDVGHPWPTLHLQAVGAVIFEQMGRQQAIELADQIGQL